MGTSASTSKFLSLVLRHKPELIGLSVDKGGWADIEELIKLANAKGHRLSREVVNDIVATNSKKRFALSDDGSKIRANQGHSIQVELDLPPAMPPDILYHGTATRFLDSIRQKGLLPASRRHVHLSVDTETAISVGQRHGKPSILIINAIEMHNAGHRFYISANSVWLTEFVPVEYLSFET